MLYFSNLLQHPRRWEVATQDFLGILCIAKYFQEAASPSGEGRESRKGELSRVGLPRQVLPPLRSLMGDFFGVVPKKVPLPCSAPPPSARPSSLLTVGRAPATGEERRT